MRKMCGEVCICLPNCVCVSNEEDDNAWVYSRVTLWMNFVDPSQYRENGSE